MPKFTFQSKFKKIKKSKLSSVTSNAICKSFFALSLLIFFCKQGLSQITSYKFKATSGTYASITGGTTITLATGGNPAANPDNGWSTPITLPSSFNFTFNGVAYTSCNVSTNGFMTLGGNLVSAYNNNSSNPGGLTSSPKRPILAPLWDDIYPGSVTYKTLNAAPNRIFVVQWDQAKWDYNAASAVLSFQVRLYETSNTIQFIYNSLSGTYNNVSGGASVGIAGASTGSNNFLSVNQLTTTTAYSNTAETKTISNKPVSGLTFTFYTGTGKDWIGSGNIGTGTDFNAPENWNPAGTPDANDACTMTINNFANTNNPFATLSDDATIKSLSVNFTGTGSTQKTFNLSTAANDFSIAGDLTLTNNSISDGGGTTTTGHSLNFNIGDGSVGHTTTIGSPTSNFILTNLSSQNFYNTTNLVLAPSANLINNGNAIFDQSSPSKSKVSLSLGGKATFNGDVTFGQQATSITAGTAAQVIFASSAPIQTLTDNASSQLLFPPITVSNTTPHYFSLAGSNNIQVNASAIPSAIPNALVVSDNSILDLNARTLNVSGNTSTGILFLGQNAFLKCGASSGGAAGSNFPKFYRTYTLDPTSTVEYYNNIDQTIASFSGGYGALSLQGTGTKTLAASTTARGVVTIGSTTTKLNLNDKTLTANQAFAGSGSIIGSQLSGIVSKGNATINFDQTTGTDNNYLKRLTINSGTLTLGNALNIAAGTETIDGSGNGDYGTVTVNGTLNTNDVLTLKSNSGDVAARVAQSSGTINGEVTVERFIPAKRAWRFLTVPFSSSTQSINDAWQEGQVNLDVYTQTNTVLGFGTDITYDGNRANGFDPNITTNPSIKVWNPGTTTWSASIPTTIGTNITAYKAYCLFIRGSRAVDLSQGKGAITDPTVLRAKGKLYQGSFSMPINSTTMPGFVPGSWIFLGNPYPSSIDLAGVLTNSTGVFNKFYIWDASIDGAYSVGGYKTYNFGMKVPENLKTNIQPTASTIIQSGQAFIAVTDASVNPVTLNFNEVDKTAIAPDEKKVFGPTSQLMASQITTPLPRAYINLENVSGDSSILIDGVGVIFRSDFSTDVTSDDAIKIWSNGNENANETISLYRNGRNIAIEALPIPDSTSGSGTRARDTVFLRPNYLSSKDYYIKILPKFIPSMVASAKLVDQYLDSIIPIPKNGITSYRFTANSDTSSYRNRFVIIFGFNVADGSSQTTPDSSLFAKACSITSGSNGITIFPNPASLKNVQLRFSKMEQGIYEVNIYNPAGIKVLQTQINHSGGTGNHSLILNSNLPTGLYQVDVTNKITKSVSNLSLLISK